MPVISRIVIAKPRHPRICSRCGEKVNENVARLYGMAHEGDQPYVIYQHADVTICQENERQMWDRLASGSPTSSHPVEQP